ncbi:Hypothetical_protein [Hexamita inflata]|uniref:Hypothetical_protein n=1 Tax=Hexamita inflata TaxID=28002 RepID=A0AA86QW78_9EUKA|nr:Hypothetical protein HINF_LOCUS48503 [Hexamita inflata]
MPLCPQEFTKQNFHRFAFPLFLSKTSLHYFENALASELQKSRTQIFCGWCLKRQRSPDTIVRRPNICQAPVSALDAVRCSFQVSFYDVGHSSRRQVGAQQSFCVSNTSKLPSIHQRPTGENAQLGRHQKQRALQDASKMNLRLEHRCAQRRTGRAKSNAAEGINENTNMLEPARAPYCTSICSAKQRADLRQTDTARTKEFVVS